MEGYSLRQIYSNISWSFLGGGLSGLFAFLGSMFVARNLKVDDYGILQLATTYFLFLQLLENFAHPNILKIEMLNKPMERSEIIVASGYIILLCNVLCICILAVGYYFQPSKLLLMTILMTGGQLLRFGAGLNYCYDVSLQSYKNQLSSISGNLIANVYRILISFTGVALWQSLYIFISNFVSLVGVLFFWKSSNVEIHLVFDSKRVLSILKKSGAMTLIAFLTICIYKIDVVILGFYGLHQQISFYSNAVKFSEPWNFLATGVISSLLPGIISGKKNSLLDYYRRLRRMFSILFLCAFVIAILFSLLAKQIVLTTFGPRYQEAIPLLRLHVWGNVFLFYSLGQQVWEINEKMKQFLFFKLCCGVLVNLCLNVYLVPQYGGMGCVISSLITYFFVAIGFNVFHKKARFLNRQIFKSILEIKELFYK